MITSPIHADAPRFVPETRFGHWFLGTETWFQSVLKVAILDLYRLIEDRKKSYPVVVDVGCGRGRALRMLKILLRPTRLVGVDILDRDLTIARERARRDRLEVELLQNDCAALDLADGSADVVFCHQTFHHLVQQERALSEFRRVLRPGGLLLFSESTRAYIHSWIIRLLFAHPMDVQRTAGEYLAMIRGEGFELSQRAVSCPYLWWSRPDLGLLERLGFPAKPRDAREETLVNLVARKPG
jgi:SAM-dependent methyltransferase